MTRNEIEQRYAQDLRPLIEAAWASGLPGDIIGFELRSLAYEVSQKWNAELDRRNLEHMTEYMNKVSART